MSRAVLARCGARGQEPRNRKRFIDCFYKQHFTDSHSRKLSKVRARFYGRPNFAIPIFCELRFRIKNPEPKSLQDTQSINDVRLILNQSLF